MAVGFNNAAILSTSASGNSINFTTSGTDRVLVVMVFNLSAFADPTTCTYNGVALTKLGTTTLNSAVQASLWYLVAPSTGSNTLVVSRGADTFMVSIISLIDSSGVLQDFSTDYNGANFATVNVTSGSSDMIVAGAFVGNAGGVFSTSGGLNNAANDGSPTHVMAGFLGGATTTVGVNSSGGNNHYMIGASVAAGVQPGSTSPSVSPSQSPSASKSPSVSPSLGSFSSSVSPSHSVSPSSSVSPSASKSPSFSPSVSPSAGFDFEHSFMAGATVGNVQNINIGRDDDQEPIYYELETQELEFGNRFVKHRLSDKLVVASENAANSKLEIKIDDQDFRPVNIDLGKRVNDITLPPNMEGHYATLRWSGNSKLKSPILEGFYFSKVDPKGILNG